VYRGYMVPTTDEYRVTDLTLADKVIACPDKIRQRNDAPATTQVGKSSPAMTASATERMVERRFIEVR
jgi:hypothetical protein